MMNSNNGNNTQKIAAAFVIMLSVVIVTAGVNAYNDKQHSAKSTTTSPEISANTTTTPESTTPTQTAETPAASPTTSDAKDGTYTAKSEYYVPHGYEDISVTLTIKDGVVTDSQITNSEDNPESARYQQRFTTSYKSYVVGKKASGLKLQYVAGASDTTDGFNDALDKILSQAQA